VLHPLYIWTCVFYRNPGFSRIELQASVLSSLWGVLLLLQQQQPFGFTARLLAPAAVRLFRSTSIPSLHLC
jgi:hypothetical protein